MDTERKQRVTAAFAELTKAQHIEPEMLSKHSQGLVEAPLERARIECHLSVCDQCLALFEGFLTRLPANLTPQDRAMLEHTAPRVEQSLALLARLHKNHDDLVARVAAIISGSEELWLIREVLDALERSMSEASSAPEPSNMALQAAALTSGAEEGASTLVNALLRAKDIATAVEDAVARIPRSVVNDKHALYSHIGDAIQASAADRDIDRDGLNLVVETFVGVLTGEC